MTEVNIQRQAIRVGLRFAVSFQRTLRIPNDGQTYPLPPGLGIFPIFPVAEFAERLPPEWSQKDAFIPLYQREALWLGFHGARWKPNAVQVRIGGVNVLTGETGEQSLLAEPQNYLVCPEQPWLDGIVTGSGAVRQFVAMRLGHGYTVEAALTGEERQGAIELTVYEPRPGIFPDQPPAPETAGQPRAAAGLQMGLGAGGKMKQKIYRDRHGIEVWDRENFGRVTVHLLNSAQFREVTGFEPPTTPIDAAAYAEAGLPWFDLYDEERAGIAAAPALAGVKTIAQHDQERGAPPAEAGPIDAEHLHVRKLWNEPPAGQQERCAPSPSSNPAEPGI